jgi:uncharacterized protein (DUF1330 family)
MSTYLLVNAKVVDADLLLEYGKNARSTMEGHPINPIIVTNDAEVLEGTPAGNRVVMLEFPDRAALMAWYNSPAYQAIIGQRFASTEGFALIVEGR